MSKRLWALAGAVLAGLALSGCQHGPSTHAEGPPAPGHGIGIYKVGQPYQVNGVWYYPSSDITYDETGIGSWYGPGFQEHYTANGEIFDQNEVTAAHKTLPLPSIAQVTNLENGRSIQVRVNDRGPYVGSRIIDLSRRAAQLLGYDVQGTAKVRVRLLVPETLQAQSLAKENGGPEVGEAPPPAVAAPREAVVAQNLPPPSGARTAAPPPSKPLPAPPPSAASAPPPMAPAGPVPPGPPLSNAVTVLPVQPTHIFVQAGAFASNGNAERMRARLTSLGPVTVTAVRVNGLDVYRVRLGPLSSVDDADSMLARTVGAGVPEARIVVD